MAKSKSTVKKENKETVTVQPIRLYRDIELGKIVDPGTAPFEVTKARAEVLLALNLVKIIEK